jgi:RNA polymerase sigma factor (sigma-70 family)
MNFEDLCKLIPEVNSEKLPSSKYLRENVEVLISDSSITVYKNGYFSYTDGIHTTVFTKNDCSEFSYKFSDGTESIIDNIDELDWRVVLFVVGEERIKENRKSNDEKHLDDFSDKIISELKDDYNFLEEFESDGSINALLSNLTEKQKQILGMYYIDGMTYQEISIKVNTSYSYILKTIKRSTAKINRIFKKSF